MFIVQIGKHPSGQPFLESSSPNLNLQGISLRSWPQLKNSRQHSNVYINHDQSLQERKSASNLKAIVDAVNRGDKLALRGSGVFSNGSITLVRIKTRTIKVKTLITRITLTGAVPTVDVVVEEMVDVVMLTGVVTRYMSGSGTLELGTVILRVIILF